MKKSPKGLSVGFLYDDTLDSTDGVAQYVKTLGAWLSANGHKVSYLVGETKMPDWAGGKVYSLARNRGVIFNGNRLSIPMPADTNRIKRLLKDEHFDVLHVQVPYSPFMAKHVIDLAASETAVVGTFHIYPSAPWVNLGTRFLRFLLGGSTARFDQFISVSEPAAGFAKKTFRVNSKVVPNMVELKRYSSDYSKASKPGNGIVFLGRLVKRKGCMQLLRAFRVLLHDLPDARLTIAGDGPERAVLENYVKRHNLSDEVRFIGYIDEADKPALLAGADIACFPALHGESFGIVLIEAMAAGAGVVVGGDNPGYASVLGERKELLINPRDAAGFAASLQRILSDKRLAAGLHARQAELVKRYDVETVAPQVVDIYGQAIARRQERMHN